MLSLLLFTLTFSAHAQALWSQGMVGQGPVVEQNLNIEPFQAVKLSLSGHVFITQGNTQQIRVEGQQNIIDNIKTEVKDGRWVIGFRKIVRRHDKLHIYITVPTLNDVRISGDGHMTTESNFINNDELFLGVSGSGHLQFMAQANILNARISGSGNIKVQGDAQQSEMRISGSGHIKGQDFKVQDCNIHISGSGNCNVHAVQSLHTKISGSGNVLYDGTPRVSMRTSGSGSVKSRT